jgi:hypothetical protein
MPVLTKPFDMAALEAALVSAVCPRRI